MLGTATLGSATLGSPRTTWPTEAVWDWRGRYLLQSFVMPSVPVDVTCKVVYYDDLDGVSDNKKTDDSRQKLYTYDPGPQYTLTRELPVSYKVRLAGEDWSPILVDLYDEQNGHPVAMAYSLTWEFSEAGTYRMGAPTLTPDPGDRQEITAVAPYYRVAPSSAGISLKADESWRYAQGVVSAHHNGLCDRVLFVPDHAKACVIERCFDTLNVFIGAKTGVDQTSNYALADWPITNAGEAWTYTHSPAAEAAHMTDDAAATLKTLQCLDLVPQMSGTNFAAVAVRCFRMVCVNGLPYTFAGTKYVGGMAHGMLLKQAEPDDFPRARSGSGGGLYRRHLGSEDEGDFGSVELLAGCDEHSHWTSDAHSISDIDAARTMWEYALRRSGQFEIIGRFATREFALHEAWPSAMGRPALWIEPVSGIAHLAFVNSGSIYYCQSDPWSKAGGFRGWRYGGLTPTPGTPQTVAVFAGSYTDPSVVVMPTREVIVSARAEASPNAVTLKRSLDQGNSWTEIPVGTLTTDLTQAALWQRRGVLQLVGIVGANAVYRRSDDGGVNAADLDSAHVKTATIATADDEQPAVAVDPTGTPYAVVNVGGTLAVYVSEDGGNSWSEADTI